MVVSLLGAPLATCSPRGCKASEYVAFDAEDEPPGASADGAASGFDSITNMSPVSLVTRARPDTGTPLAPSSRSVDAYSISSKEQLVRRAGRCVKP